LTAGKEPNQSVNPDEVVAVGAAIQAGIISGAVSNVVLLDVTPLSLGIETMGGVFSKLVERNTTIPTHKSQIFSTAEDNQPGVDVYVYQGERPMAKDNKSLGNFRLEGIKLAPRGMSKIEVSFDIDANGIVNVAAKDEATGSEQKITISASTNLSKEDVERLVKESTENAAADQKTREEADTRNDANQVCYQLEHQLKEGGEKIRENNRSRAELSIREMRQKLERHESIESIKASIGDLRALLNVMQNDIASAASSANEAGPSPQSARESGTNSSRAMPNPDDDIVDVEVTAA
jgi:molecular chaperone DnaK